MKQEKFVVWGSESDYDALESVLTSAGISYERSKPTQFSVDPTIVTIVVITVTTIKALARVLAAYLKERKRRIVVVKTLDGSQLAADNYSVAEVERLLRASGEHSDGHIYIEDCNDKPNGV
jgi:preprotein translocase subunit Sec61beta